MQGFGDSSTTTFTMELRRSSCIKFYVYKYISMGGGFGGFLLDNEESGDTHTILRLARHNLDKAQYRLGSSTCLVPTTYVNSQ